MKAFRKLSASVIILLLLLTAVTNLLLLKYAENENGIYRLEAKRIADDINEKGSCNLSDYPHITGLYTEDDGNLFRSDEQYMIIEAGGKLYRAEYTTNNSGSYIFIIANCAMGAVMLLTSGLLWYIYRHIVAPFGRINNVPQELAKGNLSVPIPEERTRYFGKFTWGINLLREKIEGDRQKELSLQKDKKLLLLSLSHDIKTPLSAIKLNAKALEKGLYKDENKRREAAESINRRVGEIESYVNDITKAASEDFMNFEVVQGEEFLGVIVSKITARYAPQLSLSGTEFVVDSYEDCILSCDGDRLAECLQNLIENAIKYGDGRKIELSFDTMDGCKLITVTNTGCLLEEKELTQIFDSFHRGSNSDKVSGNGLGLFICKRLMSIMGGEIYADIHDGCFSATLVAKMA